MTITREFTKEQLIEHIGKRMEDRRGLLSKATLAPGFREYLEKEVATDEIALASLEADVIGITDRSEIECLKRGEMANVMPPDYKGVDSGDEVYVYTAPPAPVVPDELAGKSFEYIANKFQVSISDAQWILVGWNACREAMLQAGNSQVIPDGWVAVPVEPTAEMMAEAKRWTGLTSTAEIVYREMLAAAPQQEMKP